LTPKFEKVVPSTALYSEIHEWTCWRRHRCQLCSHASGSLRSEYYSTTIFCLASSSGAVTQRAATIAADPRALGKVIPEEAVLEYSLFLSTASLSIAGQALLIDCVPVTPLATKLAAPPETSAPEAHAMPSPSPTFPKTHLVLFLGSVYLSIR